MKTRNLKFRAWDDVEKKMYLPTDIFNAHAGLWYEDDPSGNLHINKILDSFGNRRELITMQCIGKTDKRGTEIYDGDIILDRVSANVMDKEMDFFVVSYDETYCAFVLRRRGGETWTWIRNVSSYGEVVGNVFENLTALK